MRRSRTSGILSPGTVAFHKLALTRSLTIAVLSPISREGCVRFGSEADLSNIHRDVRFVPQADVPLSVGMARVALPGAEQFFDFD